MKITTIAHHRAQIDKHLHCIDEITKQLEAKYATKTSRSTKSKNNTVFVAGITWYLDLLAPKDKSLKGAYYFDETKTWYFEQQVGVDEALRQGKRVPTIDEFQQLFDFTRYKWTKQNGIKGTLFTDEKTDNEIFFPSAGWHHTTGALTNVGTQGVYWSSSISSATYGLSLYFSAGWVLPQYSNHRVGGFPVCCVKL